MRPSSNPIATNRVFEVLDEFRDAARRSLAALRTLSEEEWDKIGWSPEGDRPYHRFQETRVLDSWIHLTGHPRRACCSPKTTTGPARRSSSIVLSPRCPTSSAKKMRSPDGTSLQVNLIGRQARTIFLEVRDGRASALTSLSGSATLEVTTPVALFWRRCAGRISAEAFLSASATDIRGDRDLAQSFAEHAERS